MSIADEIRADFKRIKDRYLGLPDAIGSIRVSTIEKVERHIETMEAQLADRRRPVCACCGETFDFDLTQHLMLPSRLKPLPAAAAVNMRKDS